MTLRERLPVLIGSNRYMTDLEGLRWKPLGDIARVYDTQAEPSEQSLENRGIWKRTGEDYILGAGQRYFDLRTGIEPSVRERFRWSRGVDAISERRQITLLNSVTGVITNSANGIGKLIQAGTRLYMAAGTNLYYSDPNDPTAWTLLTSPGGTITDITSEAGVVYYCDGTNIYANSVSTPATFAQLGTLAADHLFAGAGRLIAMTANAVWEVNADGSKRGGANIFAHTFSDFSWAGGIAAPVGMYIWGSDSTGTRSEVFLMLPTDATGDLAPPYPVLDFEGGEIVNVMRAYAGVMFMGTSLGVRVAQINSGGVLSYGKAIELGNVKGLFYGGSKILLATQPDVPNATGTADDSGLVALGLDRFTQPLVPSWQSWLLAGAHQSDCLDVNKLNGKTVFTTSNGSNVTIWVESTTKVATGEMRTGGITYGTPELMSASSVEFDFDSLPAGASISTSVYDRINGTETTLGSASVTGDTDLIHRFTSAYTFEEAELSIVLNRATDTTTGPTFRRWTLRSVPLVKRSSVVELPLMLFSDVQTDPEDVPIRLDPLTEFIYLEGLAEALTPVQVEIGTLTFMARVKGLTIQPTYSRTVAYDWIDEPGRDFFNGIWFVELETISDVPYTVV